jgi:probable phosphoglycerate mutase
MATILLIRHAETDYVRKGRLAGRLPGVHLNERGVIQADALGARLSGANLKAVYTSPLERATETAEAIARHAGLEAALRPAMIEVDFGGWEGRTLKQLRRRKLWRSVELRPSMARFPGGESFAEAQMRIYEELLALSKLHRPKDLLAAVSHGDIIKLAAAYFLGIPLDQFQRLLVFPASITTLQIGEHGARLVNLNLTYWDEAQ